MSQTIFRDPYLVSGPTRTGVGNGTLTITRLTHFTVAQTYTVICTATAPFTVFNVIGSLDGPVGVAVVGQLFTDEDLKVFLNIEQGSTLFEIGDQFVFEVAQGTDLNQDNLDEYDELPQKNFSPGLKGTFAGDDNLRFSAVARLARVRMQDLLFTSKLLDEAGNAIVVEYENTSGLNAASKAIQDLLFTADVPGAAGNAISIEYIPHVEAVSSRVTIQNLIYEAQVPGTGGDAISIQYVNGGSAVPAVSVLGNAITVTFLTGQATADQIKVAVNAHAGANALVICLTTGDGTTLQTSPVAATNLTGGVNSSGKAGFEVVTVVVNAITVQLESGVSTATQVKAAIDGYGPAAALVNVTLLRAPGAPQAAPNALEYLEGGTDASGGPGAEIVTVNGTQITVGFQSSLSTAAQIKTAIEAVPAAAAIVDITVPGSGSALQTVQAAGRLRGGLPANHWAFNVNDLSDPLATWEGSGSLGVTHAIIHGRAFVRDAATFKSTILLDDMSGNSGTALSNPQLTINRLIHERHLFIGTENNSKVQWSAPNLIFTSPIALRFLETGIINRILQGNSPIALADGQSVYVTVNPNANANLTPVIATTIPHGELIVRIATRIGNALIFFDNTLAWDGQFIRIGQGLDLTVQVMTLLEGGGVLSYDEVVPGRISWTSALHIRPLGSSADITIPSDTIDLADDEVAYVEIDDPIQTATKTIQKTARSDDQLMRTDRFWIFHRTGSRIMVRNGSSLVPGEERPIGEPISNDIFTYLGSSGETDNAPNYTDADGLDTAPHYIADSDNLTKTLAKLDDGVFIARNVAWQNLNVRLVGGGKWLWIDSTHTLSWDAQCYVQVPGLLDNRNTILLNSVLLENDGDVAYVVLNRSAGAAANLSPVVARIEDVPNNNDIFIFARRTAQGIIIGCDTLVEHNTYTYIGGKSYWLSDIVFDGVTIDYDVNVSSKIADARVAQFSLLDNANNFENTAYSIKRMSETTVRISGGVEPIPAGTYRLIGKA